MAKKSPAPVFEVVFSGPGVYPEQNPLGALARTLSAIQRLASGKEILDEEDEAEGEEGDSSLRLLNVLRGSAVFRFACPVPNAATAAVNHLKWVQLVRLQLAIIPGFFAVDVLDKLEKRRVFEEFVGNAVAPI